MEKINNNGRIKMLIVPCCTFIYECVHIQTVNNSRTSVQNRNKVPYRINKNLLKIYKGMTFHTFFPFTTHLIIFLNVIS